ncbi:MAG: hypothetical protein LBG76_02290 [Treponema sp.]|jgi:putative aldouronate transport system substrate-binding protein|nr:hypothetical protein [Treponema sp.]
MKKMRVWRIVGAGLAGLMFLAAGCRGKSETQAGAQTGRSGGSVENQAITAELLDSLGLEKGSGGSYRFKETKSIKVEVFDRGLDGGRSKPEDNFYTNWIKEGMLRDHNVAVSFVPVGRWTEVDELNNLLAAGLAPDVCVTYNYSTIQAYANMGGRYGYEPLYQRIRRALPQYLELAGG